MELGHYDQIQSEYVNHKQIIPIESDQYRFVRR